MHARVEPAAAVARTEVLNPSTAPERQRAKDELRPVVWPRTGGESGRFHRLQLGCPATPIPPWDGRRGADGNPGSVGYRQPAAHHLDNIDPDPAPVNARTSSAVPRPGRCRALQVRSPTSEILLPPGIALLAPAPIVGTLLDGGSQIKGHLLNQRSGLQPLEPLLRQRLGPEPGPSRFPTMEPVLSPAWFTASTALRKSAATRAQYRVIASAPSAPRLPPSVSTISNDGRCPEAPRVSAACTACSISSCPSLERRSSAASSMEALSECPQVTPASTAPQVTRAGLPLGPAWPQALSALPPAVGRRGRSSVGSLDRRHRPPDQGMGPRRPPPPGPRAGGGGLRPSPSFEAARVGLSRVRVLHCNTLGWQEWPPGARPAAHGVSRGPHRGGSGSRQSCPHRQRGARTLWAPPWTGH